MASFDIAVERVLTWEGGYVNDPNDSGGETKYGISKRAYPDLDIASLTLEQAHDIYRRDYWNRIQGDQISSQDVANKLLDMAVNFGTVQAVSLLQHILDVAPDGRIGPITLSHCNKSESYHLLQELRLSCSIHYAKIVAYKPSQLKYINGWMRRALS